MLITSGTNVNYDSPIIGTWAFSEWNDTLAILLLMTLNTQWLNSIHQLTKEVSYPEKILKYNVK